MFLMSGVVILRMEVFQNLPVMCRSDIYKVCRPTGRLIGRSVEQTGRVMEISTGSISDSHKET